MPSYFLLALLVPFQLWHRKNKNRQQMMLQRLLKKLANPIGAIISVPFQNNMDLGIGDYKGSRNTLNFQPIIPFSLNSKYSLITRYIVPVIAQYDINGEGTRQSGLGDALVSGWTTDALYRGVSVSSVFSISDILSEDGWNQAYHSEEKLEGLKQIYEAALETIWLMSKASDSAGSS